MCHVLHIVFFVHQHLQEDPADPIEQFEEDCGDDPIEDCTDSDDDASWDEADAGSNDDISIPSSDYDFEAVGLDEDQHDDDDGSCAPEAHEEASQAQDGEGDGDDEENNHPECDGDEDGMGDAYSAGEEDQPEKSMEDGSTWKLFWVKVENGIPTEPLEMVAATIKKSTV